MTNLLKQPPHIRLNLELCKRLYKTYLSETLELFTLPLFEERYEGKLEGILGSVSQSFGQDYLFPTIGESAAAYFVKISTQHPLRDGNKRMAVFFTDVFLNVNEINLILDHKKMYELSKFVVREKEEGNSPQNLLAFVELVIERNISK
jgi:prophage maintenance system killer protein